MRATASLRCERLAARAEGQVPEAVVVHPLVLLSVVDHYNRVAKDTRKRVVGVLLGEVYKGQLDVTNSFAGAGPLQGCPISLRAPAVVRG